MCLPVSAGSLSTGFFFSRGRILNHFLFLLASRSVFDPKELRESRLEKDKLGLRNRRPHGLLVKVAQLILCSIMQAHLWVYSVLMKLGPCLVLTVLTCWLVRRLWEAERHRQCMQNRFAPSFSADSRVGSEKKKSKKSSDSAAASVQVTVCIFMIRFCFAASFTLF